MPDIAPLPPADLPHVGDAERAALVRVHEAASTPKPVDARHFNARKQHCPQDEIIDGIDASALQAMPNCDRGKQMMP